MPGKKTPGAVGTRLVKQGNFILPYVWWKVHSCFCRNEILTLDKVLKVANDDNEILKNNQCNIVQNSKKLWFLFLKMER